MFKYFFHSKKNNLGKALLAMASATLLTTSCGGLETASTTDAKQGEAKLASEKVIADARYLEEASAEDWIPQPVPEPVPPFPQPLPPPTIPSPLPDDEMYPPIIIDVPVAPHPSELIEVMVRSNPADPAAERFLGHWEIEAYNLNLNGLRSGPSYVGTTDYSGISPLMLPKDMFSLPLIVKAHNELLALSNDDAADLEIMIPPFCGDKAIWLVGPVENAVWNYYKEASQHFAQAWNASQIDCASWLSSLQLLIPTDVVEDALYDAETSMDEAVKEAFQQNQNFLLPTRPPICMAERRHKGGSMERADIIQSPHSLTNFDMDYDSAFVNVANNGLVDNLCGLSLKTNLMVNGVLFNPTYHYVLDDPNFVGSVHDHNDISSELDVTVYNVKLGNGRKLDNNSYDSACALSSVIEFTNLDNDEQDLKRGSGVSFDNLFGDGLNTAIYLTSDGDKTVDDHDTWAILYNSEAQHNEEQVIAVELLGHRQEDYRDVLRMNFDPEKEKLFLGLRKDFELSEEDSAGGRAFLAYTVHTWDGSHPEGIRALRKDAANCFEAADPWARQFFNREDLRVDRLTPLRAAEFAVRSQCFSNSRANQRWRTEEVGYWSIGSDYGVHGNVVINPGWLAPDLEFDFYVQRFDEAVFKGPNVKGRTDGTGQIMVEIPTLMEGDRVLLRAADACCSDYDLILPCVPEFTGFIGMPGVPYIPSTLVPPRVDVEPPFIPDLTIPTGPVVPVIGPVLTPSL